MHLSHVVETIDTHTAGNPTRNLIAGVPRIEGKTMQDKMAYAGEHLDWLRTAVMMEPRGHSNMSGTIWVEPCHPEADMGILFIDAGGHMPMCGHSTIGCVTAMLESGRVPITGEVTEVNIDTPAGLVRTRATVENGSVTVGSVGFDWLSNSPRHTTSFIRDLAASKSLLEDASGLAMPALKANMTFESLGLSTASHKKTMSIKAEGLADVNCSFTLYDAGIISTSEQALLMQSFSDLHLAVKDHGALAWVGLNLSHDGRAAATALHQTLDKGLDLAPTPQNNAIRQALLTFVQRPGQLEAASAKGQRIGILQILAALNDPGALFTCSAVAGQKTLEEQINALAAQTAKTSAPAEAAGK